MCVAGYVSGQQQGDLMACRSAQFGFPANEGASSLAAYQETVGDQFAQSPFDGCERNAIFRHQRPLSGELCAGCEFRLHPSAENFTE